MEVSTENIPTELFRPRSLGMLMGLYETNYRRLLGLLGEPEGWEDHIFLRLKGRPGLHVELRHRARYTVDIVMTHHFESERLPNLSVRLYRDARLAEAMPGSDMNASRYPLAQLPQRWRANLLLYKWLEFCLEASSKQEQIELII